MVAICIPVRLGKWIDGGLETTQKQSAGVNQKVTNEHENVDKNENIWNRNEVKWSFSLFLSKLTVLQYVLPHLLWTSTTPGAMFSLCLEFCVRENNFSLCTWPLVQVMFQQLSLLLPVKLAHLEHWCFHTGRLKEQKCLHPLALQASVIDTTLGSVW